MSGPVAAVATTFAVIEQMAAHGSPIGVSDLARQMNTGRALIFRHLRTLLELGYVAQDPTTEKYMLTPRLFYIGQAVADQIDFLAAARRVMPDLSRTAKLAVSVSQIEARGVRVLDILRYRSSVEITTPPGALFDFHSSAQGKIALAFSPGLWERKVAGRTEPLLHGNGQAVDIAQLRRELDVVRQQGWAASMQEVVMGVNAVAAPIFDGQGALQGTIALVGSAQTLTPDSAAIPALVAAARQISEQLGYRERETGT